MKKHVLLAICALLLISCANKKNTTDTSQPSPQAELSLAPGYIQAYLKILNIEDNGEQKIISSEVLEILFQNGLYDEFMLAVDNDDFGKAKLILQRVGMDPLTVQAILNDMENEK